MEQERDRRASGSTRNQMEVQPPPPPAAPHFGGVWERLVRSCKKAMYAVLGNRKVTEDVLSTTICIVEQTLNSRPLTPVSSDVNDLEALTPNHRKLFRQTQAYANLIWDRFRIEYLPTLNNWQKWRSTANETLKEGDLVWLIEDSNKRGYYNLGRVTETIDGSDGVIRSAIVRTNYGVYKRPVVKLAPVLPGKDVFATKNRAGDIAAELNNSNTKLNSASRSFQTLTLEQRDKRNLMLHSIEAIWICSLCSTFIFSNYY